MIGPITGNLSIVLSSALLNLRERFFPCMNPIPMPKQYSSHQPPVTLHEFRQVDDHPGERGQVRAETAEQFLELRYHEDKQDRGNDHRHNDHGSRVEQGLLDLGLQGLGLFLVGGDIIKQRFEYAGLFAGVDQTHHECIEVVRVFGQGIRQAGAGFHVGLDLENKLAHTGIVMAAADDIERLHQWYACSQHGGQLAEKDRDIFRYDLFLLGFLEEVALLPDLQRLDTLLAQVGPDQ